MGIGEDVGWRGKISGRCLWIVDLSESFVRSHQYGTSISVIPSILSNKNLFLGNLIFCKLLFLGDHDLAVFQKHQLTLGW